MNPGESKAPETLAERFWSLAQGMEGPADSTEPVEVVKHVLAVLDALENGATGRDLTVNTVNFLTLLRQHEVKGDLLYASPEQARGEQVDERSLVFSVGVLLFEKLTGRHPFGAEGNPQRLARIRRGEMASGVNYFPRVPSLLRVVLLRAMGPFPEERWNSLVELRAELEVFLVRSRDASNRSGAIPIEPRPLPALPEPVAGTARRRSPTMASSPLSPSVDLPRMATMSGRHSAMRAQSEPPVELSVVAANPIAAPASRPGSAAETALLLRRRLPPGAWAFAGVIAGVVVTSLVFLAAWPDHAGAPPSAASLVPTSPAPAANPEEAAASAAAASPAPVAASPAPPAANRPPAASRAAASPASADRAAASPASTAANRAPTASSAPSSPVANRAPTAAARRAPTAGSAPSSPASAVAPSSAKTAAAPASAGFDPEVGGQTALAAVRACVPAADRKTQIGASLLYDPTTGQSRKVYFGSVDQLDRAEHDCLKEKLLHLSAGGLPPHSVVVTYSFHLAPTGDQVKARVQGQP